METIAFYSYKGGVGRSLLLANAAQFLATLGKRVVALDFDFEAPGLHYKFSSVPREEITGGAVPYLLATAGGADSAPPLRAHTLPLAVPSSGEGELHLIPAGPAPSEAYWAALKQLGESLPLNDPSGSGFMAVLDLQARIEHELQPDYLLIDARTGVTELGGLATTILADTVVCLFAANQESLDGTLKIVEALKAAPRLDRQKPIRIVPVLSRATGGPPDDLTFTSAVERLLELSGRSKGKAKKDPASLLSLPHDEAFAQREKLVGGQREASAFSPLYKAYLQLFQDLFPSRADLARSVLERLEAVAGIKQHLINRSERDGVSLTPWSSASIAEGVEYKADVYSAKGSRYADLVCRNDAGKALIAVEYVVDDSVADALEFWSDRTKVSCVLLLARANQYRERQLYTRDEDGGKLRRVDRWDLPSPREFELLRNVGDRSVESMLDALRHGHREVVPWLVQEWEESVAAMGMHREPKWRPERARLILDGLAATEDLECAEEILRRTVPDPFENRHRHRRFKDDFAPGEELDQKMTDELFAPLFWRLPVEAALKSMHARRHPGDTPSIAGHQLIADKLMGLQYDPERNALDEARVLSHRRVTGNRVDDEDLDEHTLMWIHRSRWERMERVRFSEEAPPALVWDEILRDEPHWRGSLDAARSKVAEKVQKTMGNGASLRRRLRAAADRHDLGTHGLLGGYDPTGGMELYPRVITAAAEVIGISPRYLKSVVFIHLSVWDLAHLARDLDGELGYGFAPVQFTSISSRISPVHVAVTQAFTHRLIVSLKDPNLEAAFEKLSQHQPEPYTRWQDMRKLPLEKLRVLLLRARASAQALGLAGSE